MAYRFKQGETVADGVRRIVQEEIDSTKEGFAKTAKGRVSRRDEAIHEARKSIKKIRGMLRLLRPELGTAYQKENSLLRDTGHQLSALRDSAALIESFDQITSTFAKALDRKSMLAIRRGLQRDKIETERRLNVNKVIRATITTLNGTASRVKKWPLANDGFSTIAGGLELTYRAGRRALRAAERDEQDVLFHDLRKRVKDHWYHVRLLESTWTEIMQAHEASLHDLETWLGDDHNLVVLREKLEEDPEKYGGEAGIKVFLSVARRHQEDLRQKSLSLAHRVYAEKPKEFVSNLHRLWNSWREQPESMKEVQKEQRAQAKPAAKSAGSKAKKTAA